MDQQNFLGDRYLQPEQVIPGDIQAFKAVDSTTGQSVFVHRINNTSSPEQASVLKLLLSCLYRSATVKEHVIDVQEQADTCYVVTLSAPQCLLLREWLQFEADRSDPGTKLATDARTAAAAPPLPPQNITQSIPVSPPGEVLRPEVRSPSMSAPPSRPVPTPASPSSGLGAGEFTMLFQGAGVPVATKPAAAPTQPAERSSITAEHTQPVVAPGGSSSPVTAPPPQPLVSKTFPSESTPSTATERSPSIRPITPIPPPPPPSAPPPAASVGEFTQMFQSSTAKPPAPPPVTSPGVPVPPKPIPAADRPKPFSEPAPRPAAPPPPPPANQPLGEFTQLFQQAEPISPPPPQGPPLSSGLSKSAHPPEPPPPSPQPIAPQRFSPPAPPPDKGEPGEFTRFFASGGVTPPQGRRAEPFSTPPPASQPGVQRPSTPFIPPSGSSSPAFPPPAPPPAAAGAGEFTRMFSSPPERATPSAPFSPPPPPAGQPQQLDPFRHSSPAHPGSSTGEYTRMFGGGAPDLPSAPPSYSGKEAGEYTKLFGKTSPNIVPPPMQSTPAPPAPTPLMNDTPAPIATPPAAAGPSEFTRVVMGRSEAGAPGAAGGAPGAAGGAHAGAKPPAGGSGASPIHVNVSPINPMAAVPSIGGQSLHAPSPHMSGAMGSASMSGPSMMAPGISSGGVHGPTMQAPHANLSAPGMNISAVAATPAISAASAPAPAATPANAKSRKLLIILFLALLVIAILLIVFIAVKG